MGQIGSHTFDDSTDPLATSASAVGSHSFETTDNTSNPCNGTTGCSDAENDTDV